ncbi:flagellar type III secretion system pore protein FliP [Tepidibacter sp. Z1-5]|uniref:flagellar type III secretion system pore protein FliP n=1 Tax=Tepidibacter sp. Z1-5 TaxID=3134138 RepID=UPI0030C07901
MNGTTDPGNLSSTVEIILLFTVLSLLPSIIIMMTSFTRIIIVLSFLRNALATQQNPPTQVLIGLALFLTFFIMAPVGTEIYDNALNPYFNQQISQEEAFEKGMEPVRNFMFRQTREKDVLLFLEIAKIEKTDDLKVEDVPNRVLIPAFLISELKTGFQMGFVLFIPFIIVDMVVASTLMSMGMMMLPPVMISLPFKILLFILVDGWNLVVKSIVLGFK